MDSGLTRLFGGWAAVALIVSAGGCGSTAVRTVQNADRSADGAPRTEELRLVYRSRRNGQPRGLNVSVFLPERSGPYATVIINHGSPRSADARKRGARYPTATDWFLARGMAVVVPNRRGYGGSDGPYSEGFGKCRSPNYVRAGNATADDIGLVVGWLSSQPWVLRRGIVVLGASAGGWGALALAGRQHPQVAGVISFAGGRGSPRDGFNCGPEALVRAARLFGGRARVPSLWVYSVNDPYFRPNLARRMYRAFRRETKTRSQFVMLPVFQKNGHALLSSKRGPRAWGSVVGRYLDEVLPR